MVGLATRQRETYFKQAESLAKKFPDLGDLEERMRAEAKVIVKGLRDRQMKFDEYERAMVDKTLTSALAAVYLGTEGNRPKEKMEKAWPSIVGGMLPPLNTFLDETKLYLDNGVLKYDDDSLDFAQGDSMLGDVLAVDPEFDPEYPSEWMDTSPAEQAAIETAEKRAVGQTWPALFDRVTRYVASPAYSFFNLGIFMNRQEQGYKEMRRIAHIDRRVCPDCVSYDQAGWQPLGELPMPGRGCRCWDRCRCRVEYR